MSCGCGYDTVRRTKLGVHRISNLPGKQHVLNVPQKAVPYFKIKKKRSSNFVIKINNYTKVKTMNGQSTYDLIKHIIGHTHKEVPWLHSSWWLCTVALGFFFYLPPITTCCSDDQIPRSLVLTGRISPIIMSKV